MPIEHMSNQHVLELVGSRFLAARLNKDITQQELASRAGVTQKTISNLEKGAKSVGLLNIISILRALDLLDQLDSFMPEPPPRAAALWKSRKNQWSLRQRASGKKINSSVSKNQSWAWGEDEANE